MDQNDANTSGVHFLNVESDSYQQRTRDGGGGGGGSGSTSYGNGNGNDGGSSSSGGGGGGGEIWTNHGEGAEERRGEAGMTTSNSRVSPTTVSRSGGADVLLLHEKEKDISSHSNISLMTPLFARQDIVESIATNGKTTYTTVPSTDFVIPELPSGRQLTINILSTWGDAFYVGLMGIELFDSSGHRIQVPSKYVTADPSDINVLDEYTNDPRTVDKLFDGINHTCDDLHAWLAPYTEGDNHFIFVDLKNESGESSTRSRTSSRGHGTACLSMMRLWNYNKSRIHSYRGARYVEIKLDDQFIFKGEIQRAPGAMLGSTACTECILFTNNIRILQIIERYDKEPEGHDKYQHRVVGWGDATFDEEGSAPELGHRVGTGRGGGGRGGGSNSGSNAGSGGGGGSGSGSGSGMLSGSDGRDADWRQGWGGVTDSGGRGGGTPPKFINPSTLYERPNTAGSKRSRGFDDGRKGMGDVEKSGTTTQAGGDGAAGGDDAMSDSTGSLSHSTSVASLTASLTAGRKMIQPPTRRRGRPVRPKTAPLNRDGSTNQPHVGRILEMELISNWGDPYHRIGLTGFQIMDVSFKAMIIQHGMMELWLGDQRLESNTLARLIDEETTTTDVAHMWCVPPPPPLPVERRRSYRLVINFQKNVSILGLVVWNYNGNGNVEETYRGVKRMRIFLDGMEKSPPMLGTLIRKAPGSSSFNFGQFVNLNNAMVPESTPTTKKIQSGGPSRLSTLRSMTPPREHLSSSELSSGSQSHYAAEIVEEEEDRVMSVTTPNSPKKSSLSERERARNREKEREKEKEKKKEEVEEFEESTISQEWGWSTSTTSNGSFARRRDKEVDAQSNSAVLPVTTTTTTTNSIHQTSSDGLTLTEERDGDFDYNGEARQQYETPLLPTGCIFKFVLLSTHGDPHYVGLNGLDLYDENNAKIRLDENNVEASLFFFFFGLFFFLLTLFLFFFFPSLFLFFRFPCLCCSLLTTGCTT